MSVYYYYYYYYYLEFRGEVNHEATVESWGYSVVKVARSYLQFFKSVQPFLTDPQTGKNLPYFGFGNLATATTSNGR